MTANLQIPNKGLELEWIAGCFLISKDITLAGDRYLNGTNEDIPSTWELKNQTVMFEDPAKCAGGAEKALEVSIGFALNNREPGGNTINVS